MLPSFFALLDSSFPFPPQFLLAQDAFQHQAAFAVLLYLKMVDKTPGSNAAETMRHPKVSSTFLEEEHHHHHLEHKVRTPRFESGGVQQPLCSPTASQLEFDFPVRPRRVRKAPAGFWRCSWDSFPSSQVQPVMLLAILQHPRGSRDGEEQNSSSAALMLFRKHAISQGLKSTSQWDLWDLRGFG